MSFFLDHSLSWFTCTNYRDLWILNIPIIFVNWTRTYVALNKLSIGSWPSTLVLSLMVFKPSNFTPLFLFWSFSLLQISFRFMLMTWYFITSLGQAFLVKNLGQLSFFIGVELTYLPNGVLITQRKYNSKLLKKIGMTGANIISSPMVALTHLFKTDSPSFDNSILF